MGRTAGLKTDRRKFLKAAAGAGSMLILGSASKPFQLLVMASDPPPEEGPWWGIALDITRCIGCGLCARGCKIENEVPPEPFYYRTWVEQYTILHNGEVKIESPNGGIDGFRQSVPEEEIFKTFFVPKMCNHCSNSPCTQVCPVGATFESPDGVALIDQKYCIGCGYCVQACPYGCRYLHPEKKVADKCTLCYHRLKEGINPVCMEVCPTKARIYGDLKDRDSEIVAFLRSHDYQVLKPHLNTGSKLFYNGLTAEIS